MSRDGVGTVMGAETFYGFGVALLFAGMIVTFVAVVLLFLSNVREYEKRRGQVEGGGAVIVGPFPVVFGTDEESTKTVLLLSLALTVVLAIASVIFYLLSR